MFHRIMEDFWTRVTGEVSSILIILGAIAQALPVCATLLAVVWYGIQIWQSATVQNYIKRKHNQ